MYLLERGCIEIKKVIIKFVINKYRKDKDSSNFESKLSPYWVQQFQDMFRKWNLFKFMFT